MNKVASFHWSQEKQKKEKKMPTESYNISSGLANPAV